MTVKTFYVCLNVSVKLDPYVISDFHGCPILMML
jgi:hypothetical protein